MKKNQLHLLNKFIKNRKEDRTHPSYFFLFYSTDTHVILVSIMYHIISRYSNFFKLKTGIHLDLGPDRACIVSTRFYLYVELCVGSVSLDV